MTRNSAPEIAVLTPRENEVARLYASGMRRRDVGETLHISLRTVDTHLDHVFDKLGVWKAVELALYYARLEAGAELPARRPPRRVALRALELQAGTTGGRP
jgi:DNA-binding NarL/FixJ family response regulator